MTSTSETSNQQDGEVHRSPSAGSTGSRFDDERVKEVIALVEQNSGPKFGYTHELCEAIRYLLSLLPVQREDNGWVTFGRIKTDVENETEVFERIPLQAAASTPTDRVRWLLTQIMWDLPANRDWLDPAIEAEAREVTGVKRAAGLVAAELSEPDIYDAVAELRDAAASTEAQDEKD